LKIEVNFFLTFITLSAKVQELFWGYQRIFSAFEVVLIQQHLRRPKKVQNGEGARPVLLTTEHRI
jgi:hypothetical protein